MEFYKWENILVILIMLAILTAGISFALQSKNNFINKSLKSQNNILIAKVNLNATLPPQKLSNPPEIVKAVYVTGYSAGTKKYINYLSQLLENTEINSVVIDIKGSDGYVTYNSSLPDVQKYKLTDSAISDIDSLIRFFHNKNIYVIGRIVVFEDPVYSKIKPELAVYNKTETTDLSHPVLWKDNHGLAWLDPASKDVWDYDISLAKDAFNNHGFDEINFDYVRFPTDGKSENMGFPIYDGKKEKSEVIKEFFTYLRQQLKGGKISVDLFGQTTVNKDDMGIGQLLESTFLNFDYICPMVYPSHYINGFDGFLNPAEHPYEIVKYSMDSGISRENIFFQNSTQKNISLAKFRPWLQDFNMGAVYDEQMVKQEIKAVQDSLQNNYSGFMLWNPNNKYTEEAVAKQK